MLGTVLYSFALLCDSARARGRLETNWTDLATKTRARLYINDYIALTVGLVVYKLPANQPLRQTYVSSKSSSVIVCT